MYTSLKNQVRKLKPKHKFNIWVSCGMTGKQPPLPPEEYDICITCGLLPDNYDGGKI